MSQPPASTTTPPAGSPWSAYRGIPLLHTLAGAMVELSETTGLDSFALPYPPETQRALDRTVLACLARGARPPRSVPELISWCRTRPVADWPLDLPPDAVSAQDTLLDEDSGLPTELCREWALRTADSAARLEDREIIHTAMRLCREADDPVAYTNFRRLLVDQPVLTSAEAFHVACDHSLAPVQELIGQIYQPAPAGYRRRGEFATCARCRTLLVPIDAYDWWCERDYCRRLGGPGIDRRLDADETGTLLQLGRPLRQFVTWPGRAEAELERELHRLGLQVEMWPGFDAYDLRLTFPDGGPVWAVDVKDWAHPALLGQHATSVRRAPGDEEAFWVVPSHRLLDEPDYLRIFNRNRPPHAKELVLLTDRQLLVRAGRQLVANQAVRGA
ncbi:pPIWI_RE_Y domain-containing protein [Streptomyces xiamenensis]